MTGRGLVAAALGAGLLLLGACGWEMGRNTETDDSTVDTRITGVRVSSGSGNVTIRTGERTSVHRLLHFNANRPGATHRVEGEVLVIDTCPVRDCRIDYELTVPAGTRVQGVVDSGDVEVTGVAGVNLKASSGDVTVRQVSGQVNVAANAGSVQVADVTGTVVVRAGSGRVNVENVRAVTVQADSGTVQASGVGGTADLRSESGDVSLALTSAQNVTGRADSGDVSVTLPPGEDTYRVTMLTDSGAVHSDVTNDAAGRHLLDLHTDSGNITVRRAA